MSSENFSQKLVPWMFNRMEEVYIFNVDFNIELLNKSILPLAEWETHFGQVVRDAPGN